MQTQRMTSIQASGQDVLICNDVKQRRDATMSLVIDGCIVTLTSNASDGSGEVVQTMKEILLSAYRAKTARG